MAKTDLHNTLILAGGDLAIFVIFAVAGRETHATGDPNLIVNTLPTLIPFVLMWLIVAPPFGVYRPTVYRAIPLAIIRTLAAWIVSGPVAILIRAQLLQRTAIPLPFVAVTMGLNGALLIGWHVFVAWWLRRTGR